MQCLVKLAVVFRLQGLLAHNYLAAIDIVYTSLSQYVHVQCQLAKQCVKFNTTITPSAQLLSELKQIQYMKALLAVVKYNI